MHTVRWLTGGLLAAGFMSVGCGEGSAPPPAFNTRLGDTDAGTPFGAGPIDAGILQDQTTYTPAQLPGGSGSDGGGGGSSVAAGSGDVQAEVTALFDGVLKAGLDCDVETALSAYEPEQVAELLKDTSSLQDTCEKLKTFCRVVGTKIGKENYTIKDLVTELMPMLGVLGVPNIPLEASAMIEVSVVDSENATIKSKLGSGPPDVVKKGPNGWKIQAPAAITAEQVEEMKTRLKSINEVLDKLTTEVEKSEAKSLPEVFAVISPMIPEIMAKLGQPGGEAPPTDETPPGDATPPEAPADDPGSGIIGPDGQPVRNPRTGGGGGGNTNDNGGG